MEKLLIATVLLVPPGTFMAITEIDALNALVGESPMATAMLLGIFVYMVVWVHVIRPKQKQQENLAQSKACSQEHTNLIQTQRQIVQSLDRLNEKMDSGIGATRRLADKVAEMISDMKVDKEIQGSLAGCGQRLEAGQAHIREELASIKKQGR
jgi:hypothetical protein